MYIIHLMSVPKGNMSSFCFPESRENKSDWFPEGPDIKCFVILPTFHFNSNERITGVN